MDVRPKYETQIAQDEQELESFITLMQDEGVRSYLEIGARYGGSLWRIARSMPMGSRIVAVDLPSGWGGRKDGQEVLKECFRDLIRRGYDAHLFLGDSKDLKIINRAQLLAPYDCVFIDADHRIESVTADWVNYGPMARMVAFHDIAWSRGPESDKPMHVPRFWNDLKDGYRHQEFKFHPSGVDNGIGILWRC